MSIRILHLSDLHVNVDHESRLRTVANALCDDLTAFHKRGLRPDIVCVTGDLINKGENAALEFPLAERLFFEPIRTTLGLGKDRFFFNAGNHEIDRTQVSEAFERGLTQTLSKQDALHLFHRSLQPDSPDFSSLTRKLRGFRDFNERYPKPHRTSSSFFCDTHVLNVAELRVGIAALNSAWRSSQFGADHQKLIIGEHIITEAGGKLNGCDLKICLSHHPFEMLAEWDSKPVIRKAVKNFHILLNGHVHDSDALSGQWLHGALFSCTAGSLRPSDPFASYTLLEINPQTDTITCNFRKWYDTRDAFDEDTSKCTSGCAQFDGFLKKGLDTCTIIKLSTIRSSLQQTVSDSDFVSPVEAIDAIHLREVFVDPILSNCSCLDKETAERKALRLEDVLKSSDNLVFVGRPEYGKTTLLFYARDYILRNDKSFSDRIPVLLRFSDISRSNHLHILRQIARSLGRCSETEVEQLAATGKLILLIDDLNDRQDPQRDKRARVFREFSRRFPKCRYIVTITEHVAPTIRFEVVTLAAELNAKEVYIGSLNTSVMRQLLMKWRPFQTFDVDEVLNQLLYYFQHFQIPVTPLAVTLFLGVLFRNKKEKNIRNEAYLIENYLETILEKVNPNDQESSLDFRDKEDFLAHIALEMVHRGEFEWDEKEFERVKLAYFEHLDEDLPHSSVFDAFFRKGILLREEGVVAFKRRFWFFFFLAKALDKRPEELVQMLKRHDVLRFSKALAYKAGLSRSDLQLLTWADNEAMTEVRPILDEFGQAELRATEQAQIIDRISSDIERQIKEKNKPEEADARRDALYLQYEEDSGKISDEEVNRLGELITLQSDVIRNTTQIDVSRKRNFIKNNVRCYIGLMWAGLKAFKQLLEDASEADLIKLFFKGRKDSSLSQKLTYVLEVSQRMVHQVVPLSVLIYMTDRLANPKLAKSFKALAETATSATERLFFTILYFTQTPNRGIKFLSELVNKDSSLTEDFIIYGFLRCYCNENQVADPVLDKIVAALDTIRKKYLAMPQKDAPYLKPDSFRSDVAFKIRAKQRGRPR